MSGGKERLIYMANQIARNLARDADPVTATADHIASFWDPRMKAMMFQHVLTGGEGLDPVAEAALRKLAAREASSPRSESAG